MKNHRKHTGRLLMRSPSWEYGSDVQLRGGKEGSNAKTVVRMLRMCVALFFFFFAWRGVGA